MAGAADIERTARITITADDSDAQKKYEGILKWANDPIKLEVDADVKKAQKDIETLRETLKSLISETDNGKFLNVDVKGFGELEKALKKIGEQVVSLGKKFNGLETSVDYRQQIKANQEALNTYRKQAEEFLGYRKNLNVDKLFTSHKSYTELENIYNKLIEGRKIFSKSLEQNKTKGADFLFGNFDFEDVIDSMAKIAVKTGSLNKEIEVSRGQMINLNDVFTLIDGQIKAVAQDGESVRDVLQRILPANNKGLINNLETISQIIEKTQKAESLQVRLGQALKAEEAGSINVNINEESIKKLSDAIDSLQKVMRVEEGSTLGINPDDINTITLAFERLEVVLDNIQAILSNLDLPKVGDIELKQKPEKPAKKKTTQTTKTSRDGRKQEVTTREETNGASSGPSGINQIGNDAEKASSSVKNLKKELKDLNGEKNKDDEYTIKVKVDPNVSIHDNIQAAIDDGGEYTIKDIKFGDDGDSLSQKLQKEIDDGEYTIDDINIQGGEGDSLSGKLKNEINEQPYEIDVELSSDSDLPQKIREAIKEGGSYKVEVELDTDKNQREEEFNQLWSQVRGGIDDDTFSKLESTYNEVFEKVKTGAMSAQEAINKLNDEFKNITASGAGQTDDKVKALAETYNRLFDIRSRMDDIIRKYPNSDDDISAYEIGIPKFDELMKGDGFLQLVKDYYQPDKVKSIVDEMKTLFNQVKIQSSNFEDIRSANIFKDNFTHQSFEEQLKFFDEIAKKSKQGKNNFKEISNDYLDIIAVMKDGTETYISSTGIGELGDPFKEYEKLRDQIKGFKIKEIYGEDDVGAILESNIMEIGDRILQIFKPISDNLHQQLQEAFKLDDNMLSNFFKTIESWQEETQKITPSFYDDAIDKVYDYREKIQKQLADAYYTKLKDTDAPTALINEYNSFFKAIQHEESFPEIEEMIASLDAKAKELGVTFDEVSGKWVKLTSMGIHSSEQPEIEQSAQIGQQQASAEEQAFINLCEKIELVTNAIKEKTAEVEREGQTVDGVIQNEITMFTALLGEVNFVITDLEALSKKLTDLPEIKLEMQEMGEGSLLSRVSSEFDDFINGLQEKIGSFKKELSNVFDNVLDGAQNPVSDNIKIDEASDELKAFQQTYKEVMSSLGLDFEGDLLGSIQKVKNEINTLWKLRSSKENGGFNKDDFAFAEKEGNKFIALIDMFRKYYSEDLGIKGFGNAFDQYLKASENNAEKALNHTFNLLKELNAKGGIDADLSSSDMSQASQKAEEMANAIRAAMQKAATELSGELGVLDTYEEKLRGISEAADQIRTAFEMQAQTVDGAIQGQTTSFDAFSGYIYSIAGDIDKLATSIKNLPSVELKMPDVAEGSSLSEVNRMIESVSRNISELNDQISKVGQIPLSKAQDLLKPADLGQDAAKQAEEMANKLQNASKEIVESYDQMYKATQAKVNGSEESVFTSALSNMPKDIAKLVQPIRQHMDQLVGEIRNKSTEAAKEFYSLFSNDAIKGLIVGSKQGPYAKLYDAIGKSMGNQLKAAPVDSKDYVNNIIKSLIPADGINEVIKQHLSNIVPDNLLPTLQNEITKSLKTNVGLDGEKTVSDITSTITEIMQAYEKLQKVTKEGNNAPEELASTMKEAMESAQSGTGSWVESLEKVESKARELGVAFEESSGQWKNIADIKEPDVSSFDVIMAQIQKIREELDGLITYAKGLQLTVDVKAPNVTIINNTIKDLKDFVSNPLSIDVKVHNLEIESIINNINTIKTLIGELKPIEVKAKDLDATPITKGLENIDNLIRRERIVEVSATQIETKGIQNSIKNIQEKIDKLKNEQIKIKNIDTSAFSTALKDVDNFVKQLDNKLKSLSSSMDTMGGTLSKKFQEITKSLVETAQSIGQLDRLFTSLGDNNALAGFAGLLTKIQQSTQTLKEFSQMLEQAQQKQEALYKASAETTTDTGDSVSRIGSEIAKFDELMKTIDLVTDAILQKNAAIGVEGTTVEQVVSRENEAFERLKKTFEDLKKYFSALSDFFNTFGDNGGLKSFDSMINKVASSVSALRQFSEILKNAKEQQEAIYKAGQAEGTGDSASISHISNEITKLGQLQGIIDQVVSSFGHVNDKLNEQESILFNLLGDYDTFRSKIEAITELAIHFPEIELKINENSGEKIDDSLNERLGKIKELFADFNTSNIKTISDTINNIKFSDKNVTTIENLSAGFELLAESIKKLNAEELNSSGFEYINDLLSKSEELKNLAKIIGESTAKIKETAKAAGIDKNAKLHEAQSYLAQNEKGIREDAADYLSDRGLTMLTSEMQATKDGLVEVKALAQDAEGAYYQYVMTVSEGTDLIQTKVSDGTAAQKAGQAYENMVRDIEEALKELKMIGDGQSFQVFTPESKGWDELIEVMRQAGIEIENVSRITRNVRRDMKGNLLESFNIVDRLGNSKTIGINTEGIISQSDKIDFDKTIKNYEDKIEKLGKAKTLREAFDISSELEATGKQLDLFADKGNIAKDKVEALKQSFADMKKEVEDKFINEAFDKNTEIDEAAIEEHAKKVEESVERIKKATDELYKARTEKNKLETREVNGEDLEDTRQMKEAVEALENALRKAMEAKKELMSIKGDIGKEEFDQLFKAMAKAGRGSAESEDNLNKAKEKRIREAEEEAAKEAKRAAEEAERVAEERRKAEESAIQNAAKNKVEEIAREKAAVDELISSYEKLSNLENQKNKNTFDENEIKTLQDRQSQLRKEINWKMVSEEDKKRLSNAERNYTIEAEVKQYEANLKRFEELYKKSQEVAIDNGKGGVFSNAEAEEMNNIMKNLIQQQDAWNKAQQEGIELTQRQKELLNGVGDTQDEVNKAIKKSNADKVVRELEGQALRMDRASGWRTDNWKQDLEKYKQSIMEIKRQLADVDVGDIDGINDILQKAEQIKKDFQVMQRSKEYKPQRIEAQSQLSANVESWANQNKKAAKAFSDQLDEIREKIKQVDNEADLSNVKKQFEDLKVEAERQGLTGKTLGDRFKDQFMNTMTSLATYYLSFQDFVRYGREAIQMITELDTQLTEMRKVSDESLQTLQKYQLQTFDIADKLGTTASQISSSTADWMRLGKSLPEASQMAALSTKLLNVSEFTDINDATQALVSSTQAYTDVAASDIVDKLNLIGNNFAVSTDQLAQGLQNAAAVLKTQGNDLDQTLALLTAGIKLPVKYGNIFHRTYLIALIA